METGDDTTLEPTAAEAAEEISPAIGYSSGTTTTTAATTTEPGSTDEPETTISTESGTLLDPEDTLPPSPELLGRLDLLLGGMGILAGLLVVILFARGFHRA